MMFQKYINGKQHICFSIDELFEWQDKLDSIEDQDHPAWKLFDQFLWDAEGLLEFSPAFLAEMEEIMLKIQNGDLSDFVPYECPAMTDISTTPSDIIGDRNGNKK